MTLAYVNLLHSGTGFVLNGLFAGRWARMDYPDAMDYPVAFSHFWLSHYDWLDAKLPKYAGVITTTRNGIEASWRKRRPWAIEDLEPERALFAKLIDQHQGITIDLDDPEQRQRALDDINRRFDLSLTTDWQPLPSMY